MLTVRAPDRGCQKKTPPEPPTAPFRKVLRLMLGLGSGDFFSEGIFS